MGEVAAVAQVLKQQGILSAITERVRFARARMGTYDLLDFVVVLVNYALSAEPTLQAFYERLWPFADEFMTLFGRKRLPSRSALSRFLAALDHTSVENLRTLFQQDPPGPQTVCGSGWDHRSMRPVLAGCRCGWHQESRSPTRLTPDRVAACCTPSL